MKIAQISKWDRRGGGASRVAEDLTYTQKTNGNQVDHFTAHFSEDTQWIYKNAFLIRKLRLYLRRKGLVDTLDVESRLLHKTLKKFDIIHFHDISDSFSPASLSKLSKEKKVVWTLHDMSVVTAGCIYPLGCDRYKTSCYKCPQAGNREWPLRYDVKQDKSTYVQKKRLDALRNSNITLVSPSRWLKKQIEETGLISNKIHVIPNGIDRKIFNTDNLKLIQKEDLGFSKDSFVLLYASGNIFDLRKGGLHLENFCRTIKCRMPEACLLLVGNSCFNGPKEINGVKCFFTGGITSLSHLASIYSTADCLLMLSAMDNLPLTVLEATQLGLPTFGFDVGGIGECLFHEEGNIGNLSDYGNIEELVEIIVLDKANGNFDKYVKNIPNISRKFDLDTVSNQYLELYSQV
jgi:glycosyltransferase involved in cell wall biosynthesis